MNDVASLAPAYRTVVGACPHDCPDTCSIISTVDDTVPGGRVLKVQGNPNHAHTAGVLCHKVSRYAERTHHTERLSTPLIRVAPKALGGLPTGHTAASAFRPATWEEALALVAQRLAPIVRQQPQALLPYSYAGTMGLVQGEGIAARFFHAAGASLLDRTICASAGAEGLTHTLGGKVGMRVEQFAHSQLIVIWGSNPITSSVHFWRHAQAAKRAGATLWCIDPRRSETADKCDHHLPILPGTDAALAYALMHQWITHDWLDHDYIAQHTLGFDGLAQRAAQWPPERAAAYCGVSAQAIVELAAAMGQTARANQPVAIRLNYGMQRTRGGGNAVRAVACLPALLGAWRHAAGGLLMSSSGQFPVQRAALQRPDLLGGQQPRTINMSTIGNALLHPGDEVFGPKVQALIVYNSNPLAVAPESAKVAAGFARPDLFTVVLEHFQTDTADYADVVLPATTQLEHWDIHLSYGHTDVLLNRPAIAPQGQALPNSEIFRRLAQALAPLVPERAELADPALQASDEALIQSAFGDAVSMPELMAHGFAHLPLPDAPFAAGGFPTATGCCNFYSAELAALGHSGWPEVLPNYESAGADSAYPLAMISPPARHFLNSSFVNVQALRQMEGEPYLELHPQDAAARDIADGSVVRVFNQRGSYRCVARISERARPGVVVGLGLWWRKHGLDGRNVNELTSQALTDLGRAPTFYDCAVQLERA